MVCVTTIAGSRFLWLPAFALFFGGYSGSGTAAGDGDAKQRHSSPIVTPLAAETASVGYLSNLTNRSDSIRATSKRMLDSAVETARSEVAVQRVIFKSIPELSTKVDADDQKCERYETATTKEPLEFEDKRFASVDELTGWIMDFTQGKGVDGKSLYEQCPGKCSPQYRWRIDPDETGLTVNARVVCGLPRDRDGNKYRLSTALEASRRAAGSQ
ncbi:MAG: hypothetical protein BMS9Abin01_0212 [Gammaproteobacteria bacterium]|nr:MAG: hypothetical protein BMS9Abin01_0212 [Gammaproteobacteria bacterium]